jgi:hypothetical protein
MSNEPETLVPTGEIFDRIQNALVGIPLDDALSGLSHVIINIVISQLVSNPADKPMTVIQARSQCQRVQLVVDIVNTEPDMVEEYTPPKNPEHETDKGLN